MIVPSNIPPHYVLMKQVKVLSMQNYAKSLHVLQSSLTPILKKRSIILNFHGESVLLTQKQKWLLNTLNFNQSYIVSGYSHKAKTQKLNRIIAIQRAESIASYLAKMNIKICGVFAKAKISTVNPDEIYFHHSFVRTAKC